jgi:hypothetical protein
LNWREIGLLIRIRIGFPGGLRRWNRLIFAWRRLARRFEYDLEFHDDDDDDDDDDNDKDNGYGAKF